MEATRKTYNWIKSQIEKKKWYEENYFCYTNVRI
jgi:hypothetical protein